MRQRTRRGLALPHPGLVVAGAILALVAGSFVALITAGGGDASSLSIGPYLRRVVAFSVLQAALSTGLSLLLGAALALALARRRFPMRNLVLAALGTTMVMPTIVVVFAVFAVYGRSGWLAEVLEGAGWPGSFSIFGYPGILIAHVFLNAPFVSRMILDALDHVPTEHWRLASMLGFSPGQVFRHLDWPVLRAEIPGLAGLVFLMCFKSFAIVLALGGGPARATLEVAIYEALKIDLDFGRAAWLSLIQLGICLAVTLGLHLAFARPPAAHGLRAAIPRPDAGHRGLRWLDGAVLAAAALLVAPLGVSVLSGIRSLPEVLDRDLLQAFATSLGIAAAAALLACLMALALAASARRQRIALRSPRLAALIDALPNALLAMPPFALTAGLFIMVRGVVDPATAGLLLLPLVNGLAALPFAYRAVASRMMTAEERYGRVAASLGMTGAAKFRIMDWPLVKRPLGAGFALAAALSFGDFGIVALFGGTELRTLPYLLYERLGSYRLGEAAAIGLIVVAAAFLLSHVSERLSDARD